MLREERFTAKSTILHIAYGVADALIAEFRMGSLSSCLLLYHHGTLLALSARSSEQSLLDNHQIGQLKQSMWLCGVLLEAAIAQLALREAVLDDVEGMLRHGAHL